ncbi:hypothetical protein FB460_0586 [Propioniferax innocua]|uniref:Uncharacterized protein n=1 Tax=Propioniferax innocua TaxID=1753 RepID=A0A542ZR83_9ACTN|nr:hypothetical protein FB460_0586 [Propioniferax innocua]
MTTATMPLRVWPGCLSCYNAGRLVGAWIDAADAGGLTIAKLHELAGVRNGSSGPRMWVRPCPVQRSPGRRHHGPSPW